MDDAWMDGCMGSRWMGLCMLPLIHHYLIYNVTIVYRTYNPPPVVIMIIIALF